MTNTERIHKVLGSMDKLPRHMAIYIPIKIAYRCILAAKTNEAKTRLVQAATWISVADTRRVWTGQTLNFMSPRKIPKKGSAFAEFLRRIKF